MFDWILSIAICFQLQIELEVVRSFRKTSQNTFEYISLSEMNKFDEDIALDCNNRKIRPTIYKTFLKVKSLESGKVNRHDFLKDETKSH